MNRFKLNNRGWGLQVMLVSILVLMLGLVIAAVLIQQDFGYMFDPIGEDSSGGNVSRPSDDEEEIKEPEYKTYDELEEIVLEATEVYQKEYYSDILDGERISVTIRQLINENLIDGINDIEDGSACTGYGLFTLNDGKITYEAFLNCSNYQTIGYNEIYDFN